MEEPKDEAMDGATNGPREHGLGFDFSEKVIQ